jgi:hypothetical protein
MAGLSKGFSKSAARTPTMAHWLHVDVDAWQALAAMHVMTVVAVLA